MSKMGRIVYPLGLIVLAVLLGAMLWPHKGGVLAPGGMSRLRARAAAGASAKTLESPRETGEVLAALGLHWTNSGPPIIVFTNPG